ncbi:MAG: NUDIX hydrolase [Actinomycetota bacterium]
MGHAERNRRAARLLLLDDEGRVLLVQFENGRGERWWAAPGGGADPGETIEQALAREVDEELGLSDIPPAEAVFRRDVVFENLQGRTVRQLEHYFVARCLRHDVPAQRLSRLRAEGVVAVRWWTVGELADTEDRVYPDGLVAFLRSLGASGP